jgi:hypothetical protein
MAFFDIQVKYNDSTVDKLYSQIGGFHIAFMKGILLLKCSVPKGSRIYTREE